MKSKTPLTAGTLAAILIGVLVALGAFRSPAPAVSPSPAAATGAQASPPVATAPPSPAITTPPSPVPSGPPAGGIEAYALGQLRGEWVFAINGGEATEAGSIAEIWAVPLAGGEARLAARYTNFPASGFARNANVLARQFSPDGRRLLLSA